MRVFAIFIEKIQNVVAPFLLFSDNNLISAAFADVAELLGEALR
jgi:hypothetical protein